MTVDPLSYYALLQAYALPALYGVNPALLQPESQGQTASTAFSQTIIADQTEISGLGQLASALLSFQTSVKSLETPDQVAPATASSTNAAVASATALTTASPGTYNVTVGNLAQTQTVESGAVADASATVIGSGTITIQLGSYDSGTNSFTPGASSAVSVSVSNGSLNDIASAINGASAGVTASVVQDASGAHLVLASTGTGAANGFEVMVQDSDGNNTDTGGLSQLAYDPMATAGAGKNLTQTQAAQDASLAVNGVGQTSASNASVSIASGVTLNLSQAGSTTVNVTQSTTALQSAAQSFVTAYNSLSGMLDSLSASGGALANDGTAAQLQQDISNTYLQNYATGGSFTSLAQIGVSANADGTLSLDANALQSAFQTDPTGTVSLLNQASQAFDNVANNYVAPGGLISAASQSLQQDVLNQQTLSGTAESALAVSLQQASAEYQSALQLGYKAHIQSFELATLLNMLQPAGLASTYTSVPTVDLPFSSGVFA
jgi:flagellar hook-associated protein 2